MALAEAEQSVTSNPALTGYEKRWMRYVMRTPRLLQECLDGERVFVEKPWAPASGEFRLAAHLRRIIIRKRGSLPRTAGNWFDIDTNLYDVFERPEDRHFEGSWIRLTSIVRGHRLRIPLAGRGLTEFGPHTDKKNSRPGLRVEIGARVRFSLAERVPIGQPAGQLEVGVDLGFRTHLTMSVGDPAAAVSYGEQANWQIRDVVRRHELRRKNRQRLEAYERSIRNTDSTRARRLRRRNLGRVKSASRGRRERSELKEVIGFELNRFFSENREVRLIHVENLDFATASGRGRQTDSFVVGSTLT